MQSKALLLLLCVATALHSAAQAALEGGSGSGRRPELLRTDAQAAGTKLPLLNIDMDKISVSGVSSGGAMAVQFHVSHSSHIMGAGIIAGPPYWCAEADVEVALNSCMKDPSLISLDVLITAATDAEAVLSIDPLSNLKGDRVWLFSGTEDSVVNSKVVEKTVEFYQTFIPKSSVQFINTFPAEHAWITDNYGANCSFLGEPYINNCGFDASGALLKYIYNTNLTARTEAIQANLLRFTQSSYADGEVVLDTISMGDTGYVYIPSGCTAKGPECSLHVTFHGCNQDLETVGEEFVWNSGLNGWAEANNIVVLYPQARRSKEIPFNPKGCWDWWGYAGLDYACKLGPQIATISNMVKAITGSFD